MEASNLQHKICPQAIHSIYGPLEETLGCPTLRQQQQQERKPRPPPAEQPLSCPRCNSTNTKFCYYNNYSLSQPRYFCKGCRRYWTKGGSLRNVPVGGGCRKNKRSSSSSKKPAQDQNAPTSCFGALLPSLPPPPAFIFDPHDLTLAFSTLHQAPALDGHDDLLLGNPSPNPIPPQATSFLDILRSGFLDTGASTFDDLCYGFSGHHGNAEEAAEGGAGGSEPAATPFEVQGRATSFPKQEPYCKSTADGDNRLFMGLQWQVRGDGSMVVDPGRDHWNGVTSSWHGLVNASLI